METRKLLKKYFGYDEFRNSQEEVINNIIEGKDLLAIMPTGSGKSLCYQLPAVAMEGLTVVISPLISLMKDQVDSLNQMGISATYINSSLDLEESNERHRGLIQRKYKLLYIAPERLANTYFVETLNKIEVSQIAVDESHCISQWGHDFRPEYRLISQFINNLNQRPVVSAFTATATKNCARDIIEQLDLKNPLIKVNSFDRPNIYFRVKESKNKIRDLMKELNSNESSIIYCATRKATEEVYTKLVSQGYSVGIYHGGMTSLERDSMQDDFIKDKRQIMVATLAFGMGIDKPDVRKVIHYNMPKSMENYYQEAGRAGRDGLESEAILLYSGQDVILQKLIMQDDIDSSESFKKLEEMEMYCKTKSCLRNYILKYFNEKSENKCNYCGNCDEVLEEIDITVDAQKVISCIYRINQNYGRTLIADVLLGADTKKIRSLGFEKLSTYGIIKNRTKEYIYSIIYFLLERELINQEGGKYPVLKLNKESLNFLKSNRKLIMKYSKSVDKNDEKRKERTGYVLSDGGKVLFEKIKQWRKVKSTELGVPPFIIFSDETIYSLIEKLPQNEIGLLSVKGIGEKKALDYGEDLLDIIKSSTVEGAIYFNAKPEYEKREVKVKRESTYLETYKLYELGLEVEEIAEQRNLNTSTIFSHLGILLENGYKIATEKFINPEDKKKILAIVENIGAEYLKPIKEILPENITYEQIRIVVGEYKYLKRKEDR